MEGHLEVEAMVAVSKVVCSETREGRRVEDMAVAETAGEMAEVEKVVDLVVEMAGEEQAVEMAAEA